MPLYRTNDPAKWGAGIGRNLVASEFDNNFWELRSAINDLIANPLMPREIISITGSGNTLTFHLSDGNSIGPVVIPVPEIHWRDEWLPATPYEVLDIFRVTGVGLFSVLRNHTSAATFDKLALDGDGNPLYYELFGFSGVPTGLLADLSDVSLTSRAANDIIVDSGSDAYINVRQKYIMGGNSDGVLAANQVIFRHKLPVDITIPANFADYRVYSSEAGAVIGATASIVFNIDKALAASPNTWTTIGTITIAAGGIVPTFATTGTAAQAAAKGDVIRVIAPSSQDATLAGFYCTLVARET